MKTILALLLVVHASHAFGIENEAVDVPWTSAAIADSVEVSEISEIDEELGLDWGPIYCNCLYGNWGLAMDSVDVRLDDADTPYFDVGLDILFQGARQVTVGRPPSYLSQSLYDENLSWDPDTKRVIYTTDDGTEKVCAVRKKRLLFFPYFKETGQCKIQFFTKRGYPESWFGFRLLVD